MLNTENTFPTHHEFCELYTAIRKIKEEVIAQVMEEVSKFADIHFNQATALRKSFKFAQDASTLFEKKLTTTFPDSSFSEIISLSVSAQSERFLNINGDFRLRVREVLCMQVPLMK